MLADTREAEADEVAARAQLRNLRTRRALQREVRELREMVEARERDIEILQALRPTPKPRKPPKPIKRRRDGKLPVAFCGLASDWHTHQIVKPHQTNGRNEHNAEIGFERAWTWARKLVSMTKHTQARADVRTLMIWLGGDFLVNSEMHEGGEREVDIGPSDEARNCRDLLANIIGFVRAELDVPRILIPTNWGNHDRNTARMRIGYGDAYSYMQPMYRDLAAWFAKDASIEFQIGESELNEVDLHGYRIGFNHGHAFRYAGGQGGLMVPLMRWARGVIQEYRVRTAICGHWHQRGAYEGNRAMTNGSLIGPGAWSSGSFFPMERPAQLAFLLDIERQEIADTYSIWCD